LRREELLSWAEEDPQVLAMAKAQAWPSLYAAISFCHLYCMIYIALFFCAFWQGQSPCCQGWLSQRAMRRVRIVDAEKLRPAIEAGSAEGFARTSYNKLCAVVKGQAI
jgi:hypothetical protein